MLLTLRLIDVAVYRLIDYCSVSARLIGVASYRLIGVAVYRLIDYCSVSARLIDVAYYRLIGVATDFSHRFLRDSDGFLADSPATLTPYFPVTRLSIAFGSCQGAILSRLS